MHATVKSGVRVTNGEGMRYVSRLMPIYIVYTFSWDAWDLIGK